MKSGLRLGILITGSLLWDDGENNVRKQWREERLDMASPVAVAAAIRYGRVSSKRDETFTMVLSTSAELGQATVVPCLKSVETIEDLLAEARALFQAEFGGTTDGMIANKHGQVALKIHEESAGAMQLINEWVQEIIGAERKASFPHATGEEPVVSAGQILQLPWPTRVSGEAFSEVDMLLTIANKPTLTKQQDYHPPFDIARAWLKKPRQDYYFYRNREHGIRTFQDENILEEFWRASTGACGGIVI